MERMIEKDDVPSLPDTRRENRRRAILSAAESMFLEEGFERVSLGAIVRRSGGSLATVYDMFGNKQGLLRAVVDRGCEEGLEGVEDIGRNGQTPDVILREFARRYYQFATSSRTLALMRVMIAESLRDPEFGQQFNHDVRSKHVDGLATAFRRWTAEGKARVDEPIAAAELFFSMVLCDAPVRAMLGVAPEPIDADRLEWRLAPFLANFAIA